MYQLRFCNQYSFTIRRKCNNRVLLGTAHDGSLSKFTSAVVVRKVVISRLTIGGMGSSSADILLKVALFGGSVSSTTPRVSRAKGLQRVVPRLSWLSPLCSKSNVVASTQFPSSSNNNVDKQSRGVLP
jgi:hypothetical protein